MKFKKLSIKQQEIRFGQSLKVVPIRNKGVKILHNKNPDELEIEVSLTYETPLKKLLKRLFKLQEKKRYVLDAIGRKVYEGVDGEKTFEQLIDEFAAEQKLTFFESRALLAQYFQTLTKRGIIVASFEQDGTASRTSDQRARQAGQ
ncbi:MAG: hypothetical protein GX804_06035 [Lentisphaerae bacterium]|jgi:hypothetical protein|nr:hypothetical protein [Lentisphaerota bacterium]